MDYRSAPLTPEILALKHELSTVKSHHEALGIGYRSACDELAQLRKQIEGYKARLAAIGVLCDVPAP